MPETVLSPVRGKCFHLPLPENGSGCEPRIYSDGCCYQRRRRGATTISDCGNRRTDNINTFDVVDSANAVPVGSSANAWNSKFALKEFYEDDHRDGAAVYVKQSGPRKAVVTVKRTTIVMGLLLVALTSVTLLTRCGKSRDAARRKLESQGIPYTEQEFVNRVRHPDLEIAKLFLAAGMNPDAKDEKGSTVLMLAVQAGDMGIIEALLSNGADVNARGPNNSTALHIAMLGGNYETARALVRKGVDVNASNNEGETPLMIAALKGYAENVKLLLDAGANLDVKDKRGETPLMHAVERNHTQVIELMKAAGAKE